MADHHPIQERYEHFLAYSGLPDTPELRFAYFHGADEPCERPERRNPDAYGAFALCAGKARRLSGYDGENESEVLGHILARARREGFKGTAQDRIAELGWWVAPMFRGCTQQRSAGDAWRAASLESAHHPSPGQLWRDQDGHARVCGVVLVERQPFAVLIRTRGAGGRKRRPFLFPVQSLLAGDDGWQHVPESPVDA